MTADKDFIKERGLRKRKKAKNLLEGFGQGAVSLFTGVTDGVIGVVSQPVKGAMEDGFGGLFKGIAKGLTGLVTKPVSGVLDTISKAAEGIQNTTRGGTEHFQRVRPPRAFYGPHWAIRAFSADDAIFHQSIRASKTPNDFLETSFANIRIRSIEAYTAVTATALTVTWRERDKLQMETVDLRSISKVARPQLNQLHLEYYRGSRERRGEKKSLLLEVTEEGGRAKDTIEELVSIIQF